VFEDRRIYVIPDCSRVMQFPSRDSLNVRTPDERTGLTAQRDVINRVAEALSARDAIGKAPPGPAVQLGGSGQNRFLAAAGENRTRFGEIPRPAPASPLPVRLFSPASRFMALPDRNELDRRAAEIFLWETAASFIPSRVYAVEHAVAGVATPDFDPLNPDHDYPGASVVLFAAALPLPAEIPAIPGLKEQLKVTATAAGAPVSGYFTNEADPEVLARLVRRGVTVYTVPILFPPGHAASLKVAAASRPVTELGAYSPAGPAPIGRVRDMPALNFSQGAGEAETSVNALATELMQLLNKQPTATLELRAGGRVVDDRTAPVRPAPRVHRVLRPTAGAQDRVDGPWGPPHAVIRDPRRPDELPVAIGSEQIGQGRVVVTAYSPFASDVWRSDAGKGYLPEGIPMPDTPPPPDGWGVQRLLDPTDLTALPRAIPPDHPVVRGISVAEDGATLRIDCWASFGGERLPVPTLWAEEGTAQLAVAHIVGLDRRAGSVSFELQNLSPDAWQGFRYYLRLHPDRDSLEARPHLFLNLASSGGAGRTLREALDRLAGISGGRTLPAAAPDAGLGQDSAIEPFRRPSGWFAGLATVLVLTVGFSPVVRPWAWFRARAGKGPTGEVDRRATRFDLDAVLTEWGLNPGIPRSARQAGLPAGQKVYESGDPLTTARPATLYPFAGGGRILPPRRPVVRRRHVVRAMEAVILLDHSPGLLAAGVGGYTRLVIRLLAGAVWQAAGSIRVVPAALPDDPGWGPRSAGDDATDLDEYLTANAGRPPAAHLALPRDLETGHVLFLVSDLLAPRSNDLSTLLAVCGREGIEVRVVLIQAPPAPQAGALAKSEASGRLVDRAEWTPEDVATAQRAHADESRRIVEGEGGRFVVEAASGNAQDVFDRLVAAEFFS
jgi:hypothetical protein